jgi:processive 1,2-diacylglycerol beta-glucosyltransferase
VAYPQVTVTTDFETHRLWVNQPCERFFTATEEGARHLQSFGVPAELFRVTGIPIHPAFASLPSREDCIKKHHLSGSCPIILQSAGGFGAGPIEQAHRALLELETPIELVTVCGKNQSAVQALEAIPCPGRHRRHILGFTDVMHELMAAADLLISKPGGLTSSEALASGTPMVIINPIPGQESRNSDFLLEAGAAIKSNNLSTLGFKIQRLLQSPERLDRMKQAARSAGHPQAAFDVVRQSLELLT